MASVIQKALAALNPPPEIGGLEISEYAIRFVRFTDAAGVITASAPLPPDTLASGRLNNRDAFAAALADLHGQIDGARERKKIFCIAVIPEHAVYTQIVSLPLVAEENLEEAAALNLQMVTPGDPAGFYTDWVRIGESGDGAAKKIDVLGAFAPREVVDAFTGALKQHGFVPLAVESPSIALARIVAEGTTDPDAGRLCVAVGTDGMHFVVSKGEELFFNYFVSWQVVQEGAREITEGKFRETIAESLRRVLNFWGSKRGERIGDIVFLTQGLEEQITAVITDISGIPPVHFVSKRFPSLTDTWLVAAGAALRGRISRSQDTRISLMAVGTEDEFLQTQIETFSAVWRTILIATCAAILLFYALTDVFFIRTQNALVAQLGFSPTQPEQAALSTLEQEVREFNKRVALAELATNGMISWGTVLSRIAALRGNAVVTRVFFQEAGMPLAISGIAPGETGAIGMKNNVVSEKTLFENVSMPLSQIRPAPDGVSFAINADIKR